MLLAALSTAHAIGFTAHIDATIVDTTFPSLHLSIAKVFTLKIAQAMLFGQFTATACVFCSILPSVLSHSSTEPPFRVLRDRFRRIVILKRIELSILVIVVPTFFYKSYLGSATTIHLLLLIAIFPCVVLIWLTPRLSTNPLKFIDRIVSGRSIGLFQVTGQKAFGLLVLCLTFASFIFGLLRMNYLMNAEDNIVTVRQGTQEMRVRLLARTEDYLLGFHERPNSADHGFILVQGDATVVRYYARTVP
jgi:hypothetical protein